MFHVKHLSQKPYVSRETFGVFGILWLRLAEKKCHVSRETKKPPRKGRFFGGPQRIRTADLCNANATLYQLS